MLDFNEAFDEIMQNTSVENTIKDSIKHKRCTSCINAENGSCGFMMIDLYCKKKKEFLHFKYDRSPCAAYQIHPDLVKYGGAAPSKEIDVNDTM